MRLLSRSIRVRLIVFALVGTLLAIGLAGFGLITLFGRHVERRVAQLAGNIRVEVNGTLALRNQPSDPRFERPFAGLYWQVKDEGSGSLLRSRSLWDSELPQGLTPPARGSGEIYDATIADGQRVLLHRKTIVIAQNNQDVTITLTAAVDRSDIVALRSDFAVDLIPGLLVLAGLILTGAWVQIGLGLRPLAAIRSAVGAVRTGEAERLELNVPTEISPLVEEVNDLLVQQQDAMKKAKDRAADLAHGLRTPLTALASDITRLRDQGQTDIADDIEAVATQMRRTVERELARARLRHQSGRIKRAALSPVVDADIRTLKRTPSGERIDFHNAVPGDLQIPMHQDDLAEVLGNLAENATRAANGRVRVSAIVLPTGVCLAVEDDGPGLSEKQAARLSGRGRQQDEAGGAGLGLAIVSDIVGAYGGSVEFQRSPIGGLCVTITLPL
jgi:signal transduction histidine kinase